MPDGSLGACGSVWLLSITQGLLLHAESFPQSSSSVPPGAIGMSWSSGTAALQRDGVSLLVSVSTLAGAHGLFPASPASHDLAHDDDNDDDGSDDEGGVDAGTALLHADVLEATAQAVPERLEEATLVACAVADPGNRLTAGTLHQRTGLCFCPCSALP